MGKTKSKEPTRPSAAFSAIRQGLQEAIAYAEGDTAGARVHEPAPEVDVAVLRRDLGLSQEEFATGFGVPIATVRNWEQHRARPRGPAQALLKVIKRDPQGAFAAIWPAGAGARAAARSAPRAPARAARRTGGARG